MGDWKLVDSMIVDGLLDVYNKYHMASPLRMSRRNMKSVAKNRTCCASLAAEGRRGAGGRPLQGQIVPFSIAQKKAPDYLRSDEFINKKTNAER